MPAARQDDRLAQIRHRARQIRHHLLRPRKPQHQVAIPRHIQRRNRHLQPRERPHQLPVAIDVAIPVEPAAKSAAPERLGIGVDIGLAEPARQRHSRMFGQPPAQPAAHRHHAEPVRPRNRRHVAGKPQQDIAHRRAHIPLQLRLRHAGLLEIELVEHRRLRARHHAGRPHGATRPERHAQPDHGPKPIRPQQRRVPGHRRPPVMPGNHRGLGTQRVQHAHHVAHQVQQRVLVHRLRRLGPAIAAHIRRHRMEPRRRQRRQLMPPGIPGFRKPMAQQHHRSLALLGNAHAQAIGLDHPMRDAAHATLPLPQAQLVQCHLQHRTVQHRDDPRKKSLHSDSMSVRYNA